jgi:leucyl aminopeptidase (aminopeptidase T)
MSSAKYAEVSWAIVGKLANIKAGENTLVLGDTTSNREMMDAVVQASTELGAETLLMIYPQKDIINVEPSPPVAAALKTSDVVIDLAVNYIIHTEAYQEARTAGMRALVTQPRGIEDYIISGVIGIDYDKMVCEGNKIARLYETCKKCRIISEEGTNVEMELAGRPAVHRDGIVKGKGEIDYFPGSQVSIAPVEESINGTVIVNGSLFPPVGKLDNLVTIRLEKGRITEIKGGTQARNWEKWLKSWDDPNMFYVAHFSIGGNPSAKISGNILEDERVRGCVVFGFGSQMADFKGKIGKAKNHTDAVTLHNTVFLDDKMVVDNGNILV